MLKWLAGQFEKHRGALQTRLEQSLEPQGNSQSPVARVDWLQRGNVFLDAGDLHEAARCYGESAAENPANVASWVNLGFVMTELGRDEEALESLERAVLIERTSVDAWYLLGGVQERLQRPADAAAAYQTAITLRPDFELAYRDLCRVLSMNGKPAEAKATILEGLSRNPLSADFHFYLGNVLFNQADYAGAAVAFDKTVELRPDHASGYLNKGKALAAQKRFDAALGQYQKALALEPANVEFLHQIGDAHLLRGQLREAMAHFAKALELAPERASTHELMGVVLKESGQLQQSLACFLQALKINPQLLSARANAGSIHLLSGRLDEAIAEYEAVLRVDPDSDAAHSNLLFALNYHPEMEARAIFAAYLRFDEHVALPLRKSWTRHTNAPADGRRLRIGYVSPDLRHHTVMRFLEPVLAHHDKAAFEIFAYAEVASEDAATERAKGFVSHWRSTVGLSDDAVADLVRADRIDVLVDVAGHTSGNRLKVFARKPAPVSLSWLGYGYTTGLSAMDYYLADAVATPASCEELFSERPWRMARSSYVYRPDPAMGAVGALPALHRGYVTFGTLTRPIRINARVVRVWAQILQRVPGSRLVVDSKSYGDAVTRDELVARFTALGVEPERLQVGYHSPPWDLLRGIDITLDCFPHNSGTTLFESLYMGLPFITLSGRPSVGRLGSSILHGVGRTEWIAHSEDDYVELAVQLAQDVPALARIRAGLREEMQRSALMDEAGFTSELEHTYRAMFEAWETNSQIHLPAQD